VGLRDKAIRGMGWSVLSQGSKVVITLVASSVLAHLLEPSDFGLIGMVIVFSNLIGLLNDMGLPSALIQRKDAGEPYASSAFWINLSEGLVLTALFAAIAPAIALFFRESRLLAISLALSPLFLLTSLGMIQAALLQKRLHFKALAIVDVASIIIGGATAIGLALAGAGAWSLVAQGLASAASFSLLMFFAVDWKPALIFSWQSTRELLGYGLPLMGSSFVNYFNRNLDNMLIGKFLGGEQLGYYSLAYKLLLFPLQNVSSTLGRVMFPALALIQEDHAKVRDAYLKATRYIAAVTFPMMAGLALTAPQFVRVVFGPQWERSIFLVQVLASVGLIQSIGTTVGWIYMSQGRTDTMLKWSSFALVVISSSFAIGLLWKVEGVAVSYVVASTILIYPSFAIPFRFIDLKFTTFIRNLGRITACTAIMAASALASGKLLELKVGGGDTVRLFTMLATGIAIYGCSLFFLEQEIVKELAKLTISLLGKDRHTKESEVSR